MNTKTLITVNYEYVCSPCGYKYSEQRTTDEPQYFSKCPNCGNDLALDKETEVLVEEFPCPVEEGKTFIWSLNARSWIEITE